MTKNYSITWMRLRYQVCLVGNIADSRVENMLIIASSTI